jgi:hypothetical protein
METVTDTEKIKEGLIKTNPVENVFVLSVKEGNFVNPYHIVAENLQDAIAKSKKYCEQAGTRRRFIHVRPLITDLEKKHELDLKAV